MCLAVLSLKLSAAAKDEKNVLVVNYFLPALEIKTFIESF